jgi:predicted DNA-binding transcriptional regulator AlpA
MRNTYLNWMREVFERAEAEFIEKCRVINEVTRGCGENIGGRSTYLNHVAQILDVDGARSAKAERHASSQRASLNIVNEANLVGGESIGGTIAAPVAPEVAADDDDGGDPDPEPERRHSRTRKTRNTSPAGSSAAPRARIPDALQNFDSLPDAAHVRLPVVCGLFACSPATAWRRTKAGTLPAPVKLSDRVTAWRVGDLRAALADVRA